MNKNNNQNGFAPIQIILSILVGVVVLGGIVGGVLYFTKSPQELPQGKAQDQGYCGDGICGSMEKQRGICEDCKVSQQELLQSKCGDGICDEFEKANPDVCPRDCVGSISSSSSSSSSISSSRPSSASSSLSSSSSSVASSQAITGKQQSDNSLDADGFLWGTEVWDETDANSSVKVVVNDTFKTKYVKKRASNKSFSDDDKTFSPIAYLPSKKDCVAGRCAKEVDFDQTVKLFQENGWSMVPMLSYALEGESTTFSQSDIEKYADFVDWFVSRYKKDANIRYLELENCPNCSASLQVSNELLLTATNKIYDRIKSKHPEILIGTPGFEYWADDTSSSSNKMNEQIEYFLDKQNGAKFDFWAFHGYDIKRADTASRGMFLTYPPTKSAIYNKYAGPLGIAEIRKRLDSNGWESRLILETETDSTLKFGYPYDDVDQQLDAAFHIQNSIVRKTQLVNGSPALSGRFPLKLLVRKNLKLAADITGGNLLEDGTPTLSITALGVLLSKFNEYNYSSRLSGEWDAESTPWVEKFTSGDNKELYIFFKPFKYVSGKSIALDNETVNYTLNLSKTPKSVTLTDIDGNVSNITASKTVTLQAVNAPKYLEVEY
ncbi:MAG: hypothetical protein UT97_C0003G0062 [Parcubacteria group bacterium GW2011_GWC2_40_31]|nr:MAG: hypothetical protein UT71_C0027G0005 [Parcubacteria group bacterium GW2011_GWF2_40_10]KKR47847.1 MAG: hypothetical protein UT83_C0003G0060 [Parcubacteria group bacterium GW2011_GWA2_40_143]KKR60280.1 MAG: hypothetical protein UT97_C0003G0062 [Parcubacteria group bacterium GW2011_GWC2_40_31]KKR75600.1 MAG: hypothetical protein UU20_C0050G0002 [Parcubacteria group bacterium GW2011_GWE2_40_8]